MNFFEIIQQFDTNEKAIQFLRQKGILRLTPPICNQLDPKSRRKCNLPMKESPRNDTKDVICWRCMKHTTKESIRKGSFLESQKIEPRIFCLIVHYWSETTPVTDAARLCGIDDKTAVQWYQYLRDVASKQLIESWEPLGGIGHSGPIEVQIDESLFARRKYNRGYYRHGRKRWVFGAWDTHKKIGLLRFVKKRNAETLLPIITENITAGSKIVSDEWKAYSTIKFIEGKEYTHLTVNHSKHFVNPENGACTNAVEGMWALTKLQFKRIRGTQEHMLDSHLDEFMWRQRYGKDKTKIFDNILNHISINYPVN